MCATNRAKNPQATVAPQIPPLLRPQTRELWPVAVFSCPDEKRDCYEANNHQGGASDEHVTDMISCGARSHGDLVLLSNDWTFVRIHRTLISRDGKLRPEFREIAAKGTKFSQSGAIRPYRLNSWKRRIVALPPMSDPEGQL
jgi:hypothetical protein